MRVGPGAAPACGLLPGLVWHRLTEAAGKHFFEDSWKVRRKPIASVTASVAAGQRNSNRANNPSARVGSSNIVDSWLSLWICADPRWHRTDVLHRDAVSGGGYFMIGTVISVDMDLIGQLQPHQAIRFAPVDMAQALAARKDPCATAQEAGGRARSEVRRSISRASGRPGDDVEQGIGCPAVIAFDMAQDVEGALGQGEIDLAQETGFEAWRCD